MIGTRNIGNTFGALMALLIGGTAIPTWAAIPDIERQVLLTLYTSTHGEDWGTSTNWNASAGSECNWFGIACDAAKSHVISIQLEHNNLTGTLPALTGLTSLVDFDVIDNHLTGPVPALTGLTALQNFLVAFNQLSGPLPALTNLQTFAANGNQLTGPIPSLTGLTNLETS